MSGQDSGSATPGSKDAGSGVKQTGGGPRQAFRPFDAACLIVGIIVGAGLYETAPSIASSVDTPIKLMLLWFAGGLISLGGALCYTELATAYPRSGGDIVYLNKAYGRWAGFLFAWMQLTIVHPGDIAAMSFVFARYGKQIGWISATGLSDAHLASIAVLALSLINLYGLTLARRAQNGLTIAKLIGLLTLIVVGLLTPSAANNVEALPEQGFPLGVAMVLVLFCYGGWNEMAFIAAEVKQPERNIWRAMVSGMALVCSIYLLANVAFVMALGHEGVAQSSAVAVDVVAARFPTVAPQAVSLLIAVSALGAINGQILTGSRVSYSAGTEYRMFRQLGAWNEQRQVPVVAYCVQMTITLLLINLLAEFTDTLLYMAASVYTFYFFSSLAVIVLRRQDPETPRPYRVLGYPITVLLFAAVCLFMIYSAVTYRPLIAGISLCVMAIGGVAYFLQRESSSREH